MPNKTDNQKNCWVMSHMLRQSQLFVIQRALLFTKKDHTFSHAHKELHTGYDEMMVTLLQTC